MNILNTKVYCDGIGWSIHKTANASIWENQTSECMKYECDNKTGMFSYKICQLNNNQMCNNDKCKNEKQWAVEIIIDESNSITVAEFLVEVK